ncbi:MAG: hypothetical protein JKY62_14305 [Desulfocapsa sp.]|nr:hypothetical protein [Desulfocapsa sp.]
MLRRWLVMGGMLWLCAGCASHHYITNNHDSVTLYLRLADADHVQFASSIDKYELHDSRKNGLGFWEINQAITPGSKYFYIVDGVAYIPDCRFKENDDFGSENCLYQP